MTRPATATARRSARHTLLEAAADLLDRALAVEDLDVATVDESVGCDCCGRATVMPVAGWQRRVVERLVDEGVLDLPRGAS